ncbi:MAG: hypothetical protein ACOYVG_13860 [Bacteroidota bacterium]
MRILLSALLLLLANAVLYGQKKSKCIYGNCNNGYGINKNYGAAGAQAFPGKGWTSEQSWQNDFLEIGEFKKGKLTGKGYRMCTYSSQEIKIIAAVKAGHAIVPDVTTQAWFESGTYTNGYLNGMGILIEINYWSRRPYRISEGNFENSTLNGEGIKFIPAEDGQIDIKKDSVTGKFTLVWGRQVQGKFVRDICTDCTVSEIRNGDIAGTSIGGIFHDGFLSGWVFKDYTIDSWSNKITKEKPFKALYGAGREIKRWPTTELLARKDTVKLTDGYVYTGETDDKGKPYGFGTIEWPKSIYDSYIGYVDNNKKNGWGMQYNLGRSVFAGLFVNDVFMSGIVFMPSSGLVLSCGDGGKTNPNYNYYLNDVLDGPYTKSIYSYDYLKRTYTLTRQESGEKVQGYQKNVWVSMGQTAAEKKRQRIITNGMIQRNDLAEGDVIVADGMAQLVISEANGNLKLKSGKPIPLVAQLKQSRHQPNEFATTCNVCNGSSFTTYTYQRPPETVSMPRTVFETQVLDYTIWKTTKTVYDTYTKTFPPEQRQQVCTVCNGKGKTKDVTEIAE